uniref:Calcium and integrin binding family member 4 n=1 Tax=Crocodylus porosus TaxID=8502 RepID=A0A7M4E4B2_CROPO
MNSSLGTFYHQLHSSTFPHFFPTDLNEDGFIDKEDLQSIIRHLLNTDYLNKEDLIALTTRILGEADLIQDNMLSLAEFEHLQVTWGCLRLPWCFEL